MACKRPWSFCQKCRCQITHKHAYTLDPVKPELAYYATVQALYENLSGKRAHMQHLMERLASRLSLLSHYRNRNDPGIKRLISECEPISSLKKKKKEDAQVEDEWSSILQKCSQVRKKRPPVQRETGCVPVKGYCPPCEAFLHTFI